MIYLYDRYLDGNELDINFLTWKIKHSDFDNGFLGILVFDGQFQINFDSQITDTSALDSLIDNSYGESLPTPVIYNYCKPYERRKNAVDVEYKKGMEIELNAETVKRSNGFVKQTTYYKDYEGGVFSNPLLRVEADYFTKEDSSVNSAKSIDSKEKRWMVYLSDGTWADEKDEYLGWYKKKQSTYNSTMRSKVLSEGGKRRDNIENMLSVELTYIFIQLGVATGSSMDEMVGNAENILIAFLGKFGDAMTLWRKTGRGSDDLNLPNIYREIENELVSFTWLNLTITVQMSQLIPVVVEIDADMSVREYIIKRLKSEI